VPDHDLRAFSNHITYQYIQIYLEKAYTSMYRVVQSDKSMYQYVLSTHEEAYVKIKLEYTHTSSVILHVHICMYFEADTAPICTVLSVQYLQMNKFTSRDTTPPASPASGNIPSAPSGAGLPPHAKVAAQRPHSVGHEPCTSITNLSSPAMQ
jgi:hypothetical protein